MGPSWWASPPAAGGASGTAAVVTPPATTTVIHELIPPGVVAVETFGDPAGATLFEAEEAVIARAVPKRRKEFATVRWCARQALGELGYPPAPLLPGRRGAPQWPAGAVGSMTHCLGYRAAAVAHASQVTAVGIDAEPDEPLPAGVLEAIALPEETERIARMAGRDGPASWERLLFSCKESVFKTWYPITGRELGFDGASIRFDPHNQSFTADLRVDSGTPLLPQRLHGRWTARRGLVVSAIALLAPPARA